MTYLKLTLTAFFWGGTFIVGRILALDVPPFSAAFLRFVCATAFLFGFLYIRGTSPSFSLSQWAWILFLGATGIFAYNAFFFSALKHIPASRASLIIACNPALIALASSILYRERLGMVGFAGIVLSVFGAVVVLSKGNPAAVWHGEVGVGDGLILGCVASWVAYSLGGRRVMKTVSPLTAVAYSCLIGTLLLSIPATVEGVWTHLFRYGVSAWASLFYLGFFGSFLGFRWYYEGIRAIGPARAGVFINLVPLSAVLMGMGLLGERIEASLIFGALLICLGVGLTNRR